MTPVFIYFLKSMSGFVNCRIYWVLPYESIFHVLGNIQRRNDPIGSWLLSIHYTFMTLLPKSPLRIRSPIRIWSILSIYTMDIKDPKQPLGNQMPTWVVSSWFDTFSIINSMLWHIGKTILSHCQKLNSAIFPHVSVLKAVPILAF